MCFRKTGSTWLTIAAYTDDINADKAIQAICVAETGSIILTWRMTFPGFVCFITNQIGVALGEIVHLFPTANLAFEKKLHTERRLYRGITGKRKITLPVCHAGVSFGTFKTCSGTCNSPLFQGEFSAI